MPRRDWVAGPGPSLGERVSLMRPIVRKISLPALSVLSSLGWLIAALPAGAQTPPPAAASPAPPAADKHAPDHPAGAPANGGKISADTIDPEKESRIVAVVNGDVISAQDVDNRRRLFALSSGLPITREVLDRLTPQVVRELIDERLRLQEVQRRKIAVTNKDIAETIANLEKRNNMPPGTLARRLASDGAEIHTLYDQTRVQLGWSRVLREQIGVADRVTQQDVDEQLRMIKAETGQMEYHVAEIFLPIDEPARAADTQRFAETVIQQLRSGAPFAVVAAQFSQSQTALQGGDLGWVRPNQLESPVAHLVTEMPVGAISNPVPVAGGLSIVTLLAKRQIGNDPATLLKIRQVFLKFSTPLDPQNPTQQQHDMLLRAKDISTNVHSCDAMAAADKAAGNPPRPDPLEVRLESVNPPELRTLLGKLSENKPSEPLVTQEGIMVVIVCAREERNLGMPSKEEIANQLSSQRVELISRQMMRDLHRHASIDQRVGGV
jgi:peptidyl-prolyl cis-trans isomerase SurA